MNTITLREYIDNIYDITHAIEKRNSDPLKCIMEADDLPCDAIRFVDGQMQKVILLSDYDDSFITVAELLSYDEEDAKRHENPIMYDVWKSYMEDLIIEPMTKDMLINSAKLFMKTLKAEANKLRDV